LLPAAARAVRRRIPLFFHAHHRVSQRSARLIEGIALRQSRATVAACCRAVAQPLEQWADQIHVIPNGTRDLGFELRTRNRDPRVGIIGRIAPEKGQAEFMRSAAVVGREFPNARFVVCGAPLFGDDDYYREVLRLAANLPVEFLDWQQDITQVMRSLDLLVIASTEEGLPRVLLEAFSAGVPVVAFPVGGIPEAVEDRVTGFLARESLAAASRDALNIAPARLHFIARNARTQWEQNYTLAAYRERITNLMEMTARRPTSEKRAQTRRKTSLPRPAPEDSRSA
jgi:glycosyltransferase involved in cell wall biosynthesis